MRSVSKRSRRRAAWRAPARATLATAAAVLVCAAASASPAAAAQVTCTWGGTPDAPTGTFTVTPGVTLLPSAQPLQFTATGQLAGGPGCHGTMVFDGRLEAGATCQFSVFDGAVRGLPGVAGFYGTGSLLVPSRLFDRTGSVVGVENAEVEAQSNMMRTLNCASPGGFTGGWPDMFSSVLTVWGGQTDAG